MRRSFLLLHAATSVLVCLIFSHPAFSTEPVLTGENSYDRFGFSVASAGDGGVIMDGTVSNSVGGTGGKPGDITISSYYGDITTGSMSRIRTAGPLGSYINLIACDGGDVVIDGLVDASYKAGITSTINVVSFNGSVTIDGNTLQEIEVGTQRRITTGVTVRSTNDPLPGAINIQAAEDITVYGNTVLEWRYANYGAVAIHTASSGPKGGIMDVRSLEGSIIASDRAFDNANRFNTDATIDLLAKGNIMLSATGRANSVQSGDPYLMAVASTQGGLAGYGGTNTLRSYSGSIIIGENAQVLANSWIDAGDGQNLLISCAGVTNDGIVDPADEDSSDDQGICMPDGPDPIFADCGDVGSDGSSGAPSITSMNGSSDESPELDWHLGQSYPNPFNPDTWIPYRLKDDADVVIRIHTATGQLVRTLNLGYKQAGFYIDKEKAAYWDGKNELGEHVASGIYFYTIQAGEFAATRKMLMMK